MDSNLLPLKTSAIINLEIANAFFYALSSLLKSVFCLLLLNRARHTLFTQHRFSTFKMFLQISFINRINFKNVHFEEFSKTVKHAVL